MTATIETFTANAQTYLAKINAFAQKHSLANIAIADHIGYKCASSESFESLRHMFEENSEYIFQSIISARRIAYIKLKEPLQTELGTISFIELQDQKPDGSQAEKFDHVEAYPEKISYEEMVEKIAQHDTVIENKRAHHPTHNVDLGDGFTFCCTHGPLLDKIKTAEMV